MTITIEHLAVDLLPGEKVADLKDGFELYVIVSDKKNDEKGNEVA